MYPSYLNAYHNGSLQKITESAFAMLEACSLCPRKCGVDRLKGRTGYCKTGLLPQIYNFLAHHGEEPPLSGEHGSGTIFFSRCTMSCAYCQNFEFSQEGKGKSFSYDELAQIMLDLQDRGTHNINLVTPTHVLPQILKALLIAVPQGLKLPLVYNTSGYERPEIIKMLAGIVDIYLPDMRYAEAKNSKKYSNAPDYPKYNQAAVKEMHDQTGTARFDEHGIIKHGLIIRHLVLPENISGTEKTMKFIAQEISPDTYISLMSQYRPYYKAAAFKDISRRLTCEEYESAQKIIQRHELENGWIQESFGLERFAGVNIKPAMKEGNPQI
ncbi:MAG: radical SAM protein [Candidatus Omnitrophota bacterium]